MTTPNITMLLIVLNKPTILYSLFVIKYNVLVKLHYDMDEKKPTTLIIVKLETNID